MLAAVACAPHQPPPALEGEALGTTWSVKLGHPLPRFDEVAVRNAVSGELQRVDQQMSTYRNDSELTQFNRYLGADWFAVSAETVAVVAEAQRLAELSEGAFDVTVGPLVNLWGFGPDPRLATIPPADELAAARERVGYGMLEYRRDPPALRKARPDLYVDLSSIAKGFAVDQVATAIEKLGATDYLVEVGGELRTRGLSSRGEPWRVAIERPIPGQRSVERVIEPGNSALATSGDYRNYFELGGRRFSHTIDPATGQPIDHDLASVTVLHPSATVADGLATALLVQGAERGLLLCEKHAIAALMIVRAGDGFQERTSSAFDATTSAGLE